MEASFCLLPTIFVMVFNLELARRAGLEASLHFGAFEWVRARLYGLSERESKRRVERFFETAFAPASPPRPLHWRIRRNASGSWVATLHYRYPMLLEWPGRHHFEVSRKCTLCC